MPDLFLGLDCSTQSLTGIVVDYEKAETILKSTVIYDEDISHFGTKNGVLYFNDPKVIHAPPLMWIEALEKLFGIIKSEITLKEIICISGSGQQHGTVYLNEKFSNTLSNLDSKRSLSSQLDKCFSRTTAPIWMDSSTFEECCEIREKLGGAERTIELTGSNTFERFSGPQIRKFFKTKPVQYQKTSIIHLVSSFLASVLIGKNAPIDHADGAGMNLMNIKTFKWDDKALKSTAPNLRKKLPTLVKSNTILGKISPFFVERFKFHKDTLINTWSGDNPNSLIGVGLIKSGKACISLGTSDTYFSFMKNLYLDYKGEGHVFGSPTGEYMSLICFKNGAITREMVKNRYQLSWEKFTDILKRTPAGNHGKIMLPYYLPEIVPLVLEPKIHKFGFEEDTMSSNIRGVIEAQILSMRLHSSWIKENPTEIYVTGGGSQNRAILQTIADVFQTPVRQSKSSDSAALGAAIRAIKSYYNYFGLDVTWEKIIQKFLIDDETIVLVPDPAKKEMYEELLRLYLKFEKHVLHKSKSPEEERIRFVKRYF